jgi:hypothetical protein
MKRLTLCAWGETYGLLDGAELLELLTQSGVIGVPGKTSNEELRHGDLIGAI